MLDDEGAEGASGVKARKGSGTWAPARGEEETGTETGRVAGRVAGTVAGTVPRGEGGPAGRVGERSVNKVVTGDSAAGSTEERPGGGAKCVNLQLMTRTQRDGSTICARSAVGSVAILVNQEA